MNLLIVSILIRDVDEFNKMEQKKREDAMTSVFDFKKFNYKMHRIFET